MSDLEQQLQELLEGDARELSTLQATPDEVMVEGRWRRRRQQFLTTVGVVVIGAIGFAAVTQLGIDNRAGIDAVGNGGNSGGEISSVPPDSGGDLDGSESSESGESFADTSSTNEDSLVVPDDAASTGTQTKESELDEPDFVTEQDSDADRSEQSSTRSDTSDDQPKIRSAAASIPSESVLFSSGGEGCAATPERHPDWVEGQTAEDRDSNGNDSHGFAYHSGSATHRFVEDERAIEGNCVLALTIENTDKQQSAARVFRRFDREGIQLPDQAYYSTWLYIPEDVTYANKGTLDGEEEFGYWSILQLRNKIGNETSVPTIDINIGPIGGRENKMALGLYSKVACGSDTGCDDGVNIESDAESFVAAGEWVHIELYVHSVQDQTGRVELWQNGQKVIDYRGQTERIGADGRQWALTSGGLFHDPASHTMYVDDVIVSTVPVSPVLKTTGAFD